MLSRTNDASRTFDSNAITVAIGGATCRVGTRPSFLSVIVTARRLSSRPSALGAKAIMTATARALTARPPASLTMAVLRSAALNRALLCQPFDVPLHDLQSVRTVEPRRNDP